MDAVRYREAGEPDVLEQESIDRPEPGPGEVLVEVRAASVNPVDAKLRAWSEPDRARTSGSDLAGVVEAVGADVTEYEPGDRVFATGLHTARFEGGAFAEYAVVPLDLLAELPDSVSFEDGAAVALVGVTAWRAFVDHAGLEPGGTAFVHGGNGGVGHVAVQLADAMGATAACSTRPTFHEALADLGADHVVDYERDDLADAVREGVGPSDVVLDHMPETYLGTDMELAGMGGDVVIVAGGESTFPDASAGRSKELDVHLMSMSNLATHAALPDIGPILERFGALLAEDRLEVVVDRSYPLAEAPEAHRAVLEDSFLGKILVVP